MLKIPYENLKSRFGRIAALNEAAAMLHWDASAMMPSGGGAARGEQLATLAGLAHELLTAPEVAEELAAAHGATPAAIAIAWVLARGVTAPIASATDVSQLQTLLQGASLSLTSEQLAILDQASQR